MTLHHLNSDQRQYLWMSVGLAGFLVYMAPKMDPLNSSSAFCLAGIEAACAIGIYRGWRFVHWIYLAGCLGLMAWAALRWNTNGYSSAKLLMMIGGLLGTTGFYWLGKAMQAEQPETECTADPELFELPKEHEKHLESLIAAYSEAFGPAQWVHHIVPKVLWLHKYADHVITIPPSGARTTWLYGTLLISALSNDRVELILERPHEDTIGAIGTLSRLTEYYLNNAPLKDWNTMGSYPFYGEDSPVRGLLFCPPPNGLASHLEILGADVRLRYVAGITEAQLTEAQALDEAQGNFAGAKSLHESLAIASEGIARLAS
jgi:hypothetical protein